jgi:hypothetical protein
MSGAFDGAVDGRDVIVGDTLGDGGAVDDEGPGEVAGVALPGTKVESVALLGAAVVDLLLVGAEQAARMMRPRTTRTTERRRLRSICRSCLPDRESASAVRLAAHGRRSPSATPGNDDAAGDRP